MFARLFLTYLGMLFISAAIVSQQPTTPLPSRLGGTSQAGDVADDQSGYMLKAYSQLVLLDIVVHDRHGNEIRNLKPQDFTVLEDGVPQPIKAFEAIDMTAALSAGSAIHSTEELERKAPDEPVTILVLDELTTTFQYEYFARYALGKYLHTQSDTLHEPTMLLARAYNRTMVLHDYTTSRQEILDALNRHLVGNDWRASDPGETGNLFAAAFTSLIEVAKATQDHAGHKTLVWIGRGFSPIQWSNLTPDQATGLQAAIISCINLLRDARITLYSLDPSGISTAQQSSVDSGGLLTMDDPFGGEIDFDKIAESTGGSSMHGRNDVDRMIAQAIEDGENFYTLAYRPSTSSDDDSRQFRKIKVVMRDPTLIASSREGYFPQSSETADKESEAGGVANSRNLDLAGAINGLMIYSGIPLEIARIAQSNQYRVSLPVASLSLAERSGQLTGEVELIVLRYNRFGKVLGRWGEVISLHLPSLPPGKIEDRKITTTTDASNATDTARVRFVVRARANGRIGAENDFLVDRNDLKDPSTGLRASKPPTK